MLFNNIGVPLEFKHTEAVNMIFLPFKTYDPTPNNNGFMQQPHQQYLLFDWQNFDVI